MSDVINIVLVAPEIPHNTGAIGRVCVNLEARLHLIKPLGFSITESHVRRAALDYWPHLDLTVHDSWQSFMLQEQPRALCMLSSRGKRSLYDGDLHNVSHLVFGNESSGLPAEMYSNYADLLFQIPMPGPHARTLNLANAVSVAAYEKYRQDRVHANRVG